MKKRAEFLIILTILAVFLIQLSSAQISAYGDPIKTDTYEISREKIEREIAQKEIFTDNVEIKNLGGTDIQVSITLSGNVNEIIEMDSVGLLITPGNSSEANLLISGKELGDYTGSFIISGDISHEIPINITIVNSTLESAILVSLKALQKRFTVKEELDVNVDIEKIRNKEVKNVTFTYTIINSETNESYFLLQEQRDIMGSTQIRKKIDLPEDLEVGFYTLELVTNHQNKTRIVSRSEFSLRTPLLSIKILGIPLWAILIFLILSGAGITAYIIIRRIIEKRKKYKMEVDLKKLPKKGNDTFWFGKIAEKKNPAYYEMDRLTTHAVVAGATGGGKSISAQVIIEEALMKNIAVIVFDPTAQWSGMLRKCDDKKMLSFYPKFGLKPSNARAFPGNVRQIKNEREKIDIEKHINPGQIQIFTLNKLDPSKMDTFVASVIASIFRSDPKEHPHLRTILVFDEVHRLLPKFGGSGKGFLQIERACREFRKWGLGIMLVSQVLSDFVGEIKANINTEVQMRTRDEGDLNRLKTKYGEEFLQSLIKASVGVGMFINPSYNRGRPYFINFRPILHNTKRLSDEVLEKYNQYSETIDDLEYQIEQLEKEKVDTFDLKMELKLVKEKLMTGNFTVVDIYLEGLKPRMEKQWNSIGKKPKKKKLELVDVSDIEASLAEAQKGRKEFEKELGKKEEKKETKKADPTEKIVQAITFENGLKISSLKELKDVLPTLDSEVFTKEKPNISKWASEQFNSTLGGKIKSAKTKEEITKAIDEFANPKKKKKEENKKEEKKKEEK